MKLALLPAGDVRQLTEILRLLPSEQDPIHYNNRVWKLTEALPSRLKSAGFLRRLLSSENSLDVRPADQRGPLCPIHHKLNQAVVYKLYILVALEVGCNLNRLAQNMPSLNEEQEALVARLRSLHAIWYEPEKYTMLFLSRAEDTKWTYQGNKCAACTLSLIAGDPIVILDLLCAVISRSGCSDKRAKPRLYPWLMAWLGHHKDDQSDDSSRKALMCQIHNNAVRALELKDRRKDFSRKGKVARTAKAKKSELQSVPEHEAFAISDDEAYDEGRIISLYRHIDEDELAMVDLDAALLSTPHLPNMGLLQRDQLRRSMSKLSLSSHGGHQRNHRRSYDLSDVSQASSEKTAINSPADVAAIGSQPYQARWRTSEEAAKSYANVLDRKNPFASRISIPGQTSTSNCRGSTRRSSSRFDLPRSAHLDEIWTDDERSLSPKSPVSTLTSYSNAIPAYSSESSVLEQYAKPLSHPPSSIRTHSPSVDRPQLLGALRDVPLQRASPAATSPDETINTQAVRPQSHLKPEGPTLGRSQVFSRDHARPPEPSLRRSWSSITQRQQNASLSANPVAGPVSSQDSRQNPRPASAASTSTAQTRWSTHWREEVEGRLENAFYRERETERGRERRVTISGTKEHGMAGSRG